eukprot:GFUD01001649.1.p1 GENE.GFUD01001649.1~~GFUD01001649.1.p1  ORF type:complete len:634 (-),score=138.54 GFUD01001649.1:138-2039(-)
MFEDQQNKGRNKAQLSAAYQRDSLRSSLSSISTIYSGMSVKKPKNVKKHETKRVSAYDNFQHIAHSCIPLPVASIQTIKSLKENQPVQIRSQQASYHHEISGQKHQLKYALDTYFRNLICRGVSNFREVSINLPRFLENVMKETFARLDSNISGRILVDDFDQLCEYYGVLSKYSEKAKKQSGYKNQKDQSTGLDHRKYLWTMGQGPYWEIWKTKQTRKMNFDEFKICLLGRWAAKYDFSPAKRSITYDNTTAMLKKTSETRNSKRPKYSLLKLKESKVVFSSILKGMRRKTEDGHLFDKVDFQEVPSRTSVNSCKLSELQSKKVHNNGYQCSDETFLFKPSELNSMRGFLPGLHESVSKYHTNNMLLHSQIQNPDKNTEPVQQIMEKKSLDGKFKHGSSDLNGKVEEFFKSEMKKTQNLFDHQINKLNKPPLRKHTTQSELFSSLSEVRMKKDRLRESLLQELKATTEILVSRLNTIQTIENEAERVAKLECLESEMFTKRNRMPSPGHIPNCKPVFTMNEGREKSVEAASCVAELECLEQDMQDILGLKKKMHNTQISITTSNIEEDDTISHHRAPVQARVVSSTVSVKYLLPLQHCQQLPEVDHPVWTRNGGEQSKIANRYKRTVPIKLV